MNIRRKKLFIVLIIFALSCLCRAGGDKAFDMNKRLGRGINLGNALEAPAEGQWGVTLREEYFDLIKQAGFDTVRLPVRWSSHSETEPPYTIDPNFFQRVDWAIDNALSRDLNIIVNMHHYEEIYENPAEHTERFINMWEQIAARYKNQPDKVLFELLNEPYKNLSADKWNKLATEALSEVRKTNPDRIVLIGPGSWYSLEKLDALDLPQSDRNLIATFHYYQPFEFTHQGASWIGGEIENRVGVEWTAGEDQRQAVIRDFNKVQNWSKEHNRPINLGEFGAYSKADMDSRVRWTNFVARQAEERDFSWCYWEFCAGFGIYDKDNHKWRKPLLQALLPDTQIEVQ